MTQQKIVFKIFVFLEYSESLNRPIKFSEKDSRLLLSFIELHQAVLIPTISRWIMERLGLTNIDIKTFTARLLLQKLRLLEFQLKKI